MHKHPHPHTASSPPPADFLATSEVADHFGVDRSTVTRWVEQGRLEAAHKNPGRTGSFVFKRDVVEAFTPPEQAVAR